MAKIRMFEWGDDAVKAINDAVAETRSEMMEFAEWSLHECSTDIERTGFNYTIWINGEGLGFDILSDLFNYWLTNIKGK